MIFRKGRNSFEPIGAPHRRTHKPGRKIKTLTDFVLWFRSGGHIYYNHKFMHAGFAMSMPVFGVVNAISEGIIRKAVKI